MHFSNYCHISIYLYALLLLNFAVSYCIQLNSEDLGIILKYFPSDSHRSFGFDELWPPNKLLSPNCPIYNTVKKFTVSTTQWLDHDIFYWTVMTEYTHTKSKFFSWIFWYFCFIYPFQMLKLWTTLVLCKRQTDRGTEREKELLLRGNNICDTKFELETE